MIKQLKVLGIVAAISAGLVWHQQATLFQRKVKSALDSIQETAGLVFQSSDIKIHKYLFKVEIRKPQIEINNQNLENLELSPQILHNEFFHSLWERIKFYTIDHGLTYRLADRLVLSFNPLLQELTLNPIGEGELSLYSSDEKITFLVIAPKDANQAKITLSLAAPWGLRKVKNLLKLSSSADSLFKLSSSYRNVQIVEASTRTPLYTQEHGSFDLAVGQEVKQTNSYYSLKISNQGHNAQFHENLTQDSLIKTNKIFEIYERGGKVDKNYDYKICVQTQEFWSLIETLLDQSGKGVLDLCAILKKMPSFSYQARNYFSNQAVQTTSHYDFDYQTAEKRLKAQFDQSFKALASWPDYLNKMVGFYKDLWSLVNPNVVFASQPLTLNLDYLSTLLAPLVKSGEIKTSLSLDLANLNFDRPLFEGWQGQIQLGASAADVAVKIQTEFLTPAVMRIMLELENYETLINKLCAYLVDLAPPQEQASRSLLLNNTKQYLAYAFAKISVPKTDVNNTSLVEGEKNPQTRIIPIVYNFENSELEIAGQKISRELVELSKLFGGFTLHHIHP